MVTLFSTNCPKCKILENKLNQKNIDFVVSNDMQEIIDMGFMAAPVLKLNDSYYMNFGDAIKWVNGTLEASVPFNCKSCEV